MKNAIFDDFKQFSSQERLLKPFLERKNDFMKMFPWDIKVELDHPEHISKL